VLLVPSRASANARTRPGFIRCDGYRTWTGRRALATRRRVRDRPPPRTPRNNVSAHISSGGAYRSRAMPMSLWTNQAPNTDPPTFVPYGKGAGGGPVIFRPRLPHQLSAQEGGNKEGCVMRVAYVACVIVDHPAMARQRHFHRKARGPRGDAGGRGLRPRPAGAALSLPAACRTPARPPSMSVPYARSHPA
jgi:hypothetical protein